MPVCAVLLDLNGEDLSRVHLFVEELDDPHELIWDHVCDEHHPSDLFSTAGLFLMEVVRRLDRGLADVLPDQDDRLRHILTSQVFEMSHNQILHRVTLEAVSGGMTERKKWIETSGHFRVGNLARMTPEERDQTFADMLGEV